jgi:hypothetical protein
LGFLSAEALSLSLSILFTLLILGLRVSRMARRLLFQRPFDASSDSDILMNVPFTLVINNHYPCLVHDDVAKSLTMQELQRAKDEWMCCTLDELYDEMPLWEWNTVQHNRWARAAKPCNQTGVRPMWPIEEQEDDTKKLSWAAATRSLRRLKVRIVSVGGKREYPQEKSWTLEDAAQWELLFQGEEAFWRSARALRAAGYDSVLRLTQDIVNDKYQC